MLKLPAMQLFILPIALDGGQASKNYPELHLTKKILNFKLQCECGLGRIDEISYYVARNAFQGVWEDSGPSVEKYLVQEKRLEALAKTI